MQAFRHKGRKVKNGVGHLIKVAIMSIYGEFPLKYFFTGTTGPISTKLGM